MERKNPITAGILNVLIVGLGHGYVGNWMRAIITFIVVPVAFALLWFLASGILVAMDSPGICLWIVILVLVGALFADGYQAANKYNANLPTRKCPHCAEFVQDEARVCKHCGRDLST